MTRAIEHRGPDDSGVWFDKHSGIALGHRRLSVLDLSPRGHQPMTSASGRHVIVFNGEIYNHLELRRQIARRLGQFPWRGSSDTETLLESIELWGIERALQECVGMFSFALWDRHTRTLTLARDRIGEKPLYYGWQRDSFLFASELKALRLHSRFEAEIDRAVLAGYMCRGYVAAPHSIYRNIFKLRPGTYLQLCCGESAPVQPVISKYWSLKDVAERARRNPWVGSDDEAIAAVGTVLRRSVALQSVADVPLGAFLSGGIDSSTVVALMQEQATRPTKTFSIGFYEAEFNEAQHAKAVARHLGTDHTELYVTPTEAMSVIPRLATVFDEPFGDASAIPTILVAQLARRYVTVALSGDGGDELFAGYARYKRTEQLWARLCGVPRLARRVGAIGCEAVAGIAPQSKIGWQAHRLSLYLHARSAYQCYQLQSWRQPSGHALVKGERMRADETTVQLDELYDFMMYEDTVTYLPDDVLVKVDRASMAVGLESRVPLLDHRLVELAWSLPIDKKVRGPTTKWLLRQLLARFVPSELIDRPKQGFGIPLHSWLRGPLREWAESLLSESRLRAEGWLNVPAIRTMWHQCIEAGAEQSDTVWQVLMFQAWLSDVTKAESRHAQ